MLLGKIEIVFAEGFGLQAGVDITFKRQNRLAGIWNFGIITENGVNSND